MGEIKKLKSDLTILLDQEDLKWKQRANKHWYEHGDRNTKYFHACANQKHMKNTIKKIADEQNIVHDQVREIEETFRTYFVNLFTSSKPTSNDVYIYTDRI